MDAATEPNVPRSRATRSRLTRALWHTLGAMAAALLAYAVWRGYQSPDLILELSTLRLC